MQESACQARFRHPRMRDKGSPTLLKPIASSGFRVFGERAPKPAKGPCHHNKKIKKACPYELSALRPRRTFLKSGLAGKQGHRRYLGHIWFDARVLPRFNVVGCPHLVWIRRIPGPRRISKRRNWSLLEACMGQKDLERGRLMIGSPFQPSRSAVTMVFP